MISNQKMTLEDALVELYINIKIRDADEVMFIRLKYLLMKCSKKKKKN